MTRTHALSVAGAAAVAVGGSVYALVVRPRISRWGATDEEVTKTLPGDEVPSPYGYRRISTRAITIDAPPEAVWPWIVQMGSGRAGFYTHEWVERLMGLTYAEGHSATRIHPEWQELHVGDRVPYSRFNEVVVLAVEPPRYLMAGEWLVLEPLDEGRRTRLIARTRGAWFKYVAGTVPVLGSLLRPVAGLVDRGPGELLHHYMETGMLKGIKARAEEAREGDPASAAQALDVETVGRTTHADSLYVHESGDPGSPAVVLLHAAGASGRMWREHMAKLAGFHCLAPDLPGFGRSNHLAPLSRIETADLIAELIETRVPARRAHVVGLSWGGAITHALLDRHPELVDRAVIDGAGLLPWWGNGPFLIGIAVVSPFLRTRRVSAFFGDMVGMDEGGRADLRATSPRAFRRAFVEGFNPTVSKVEIGASCPTLLVAGEKETYVRPSNAAQAALMPHAVARFAPGLGHAGLVGRTAVHVRMVEAWLTGQELPSDLSPEPPSPVAVKRLLGELESLDSTPVSSGRAGSMPR